MKSKFLNPIYLQLLGPFLIRESQTPFTTTIEHFHDDLVVELFNFI